MTLEQSQDIAQLVDRVTKVDYEFGQDLWLIAERLLLHRLTRPYDKGSRLKSVLQVIKQIRTKSEHSSSNQIEKTETEEMSNKQENESNLASGFSLAVEQLERMDSEELYSLISWLRKVDSDNREPAAETTTGADEDLQNTIAHTIFCLSRSGLRLMQNTLYDKFGPDAIVKLYDVGEGYGSRIAFAFRKKGLKLEKTIREIEKTAQLAGWGDISLHKVSENEVQCEIKNTMFSLEREGMNRSCYFAAGVLGGIISSMFNKQGLFVSEEMECVVGGFSACKFKLTKSVESKSFSGAK